MVKTLFRSQILDEEVLGAASPFHNHALPTNYFTSALYRSPCSNVQRLPVLACGIGNAPDLSLPLHADDPGLRTPAGP